MCFLDSAGLIASGRAALFQLHQLSIRINFLSLFLPSFFFLTFFFVFISLYYICPSCFAVPLKADKRFEEVCKLPVSYHLSG